MQFSSRISRFCRQNAGSLSISTLCRRIQVHSAIAPQFPAFPSVLSSFRYSFMSDSTDSGNTSRKIKVYTKTGDQGTTSLFTGDRVSKSADYFEALGDVDELNACIGVARYHAVSIPFLPECLEEIQNTLFSVGAHIATPLSKASAVRTDKTKFDEEPVLMLEKWIDKMEEELPPLRNFILPGGGVASVHLHVARAVCRRCERHVFPLVERHDTSPTIGKYLNRLSDFFFVAARFATLKTGSPEVIWKTPKPSTVQK